VTGYSGTPLARKLGRASGQRLQALAAGLVDVKGCAVDATRSGLKLVYRREDRARAAVPPARTRRPR
jgi:hypothetical protein